MNFIKSSLLTWACALACSAVLPTAAQAQEKVLRIAMTAGDIPRTLGQPDQGYEGNRFTGITMYDGLTQWDLSHEKGPSELIPDLATSWQVDPKDHTKWIFKLRPGVKFHDGSPASSENGRIPRSPTSPPPAPAGIPAGATSVQFHGLTVNLRPS